MGGRNAADSMANVRLEEGTKQTGIDGSEKQERRHRVDSGTAKADTVGAAGGVGVSGSVAVKESLRPAGADLRARHRDAGAVSGNKADGKPEVVISTEGRSGF